MRSRGWEKRRTLGISLMLLQAIILCPVVMAVPTNTNEEESAAAQASLTTVDKPLQEDAACTRCHEKVIRGFVNDPHSSHGRPTADGPGVSCTDCHGPGEAHIQSGGDKSKIFNPREAAARQVDDTCLKCHAGKHAIFDRSAHGRNNVSCVRCHSIHAAHESRYLLTIAQPALCFQCHDEERSQFSAPFRHKVMEGLILCTDCHEPHGSFGEQVQRSSPQQDIICTKCHTEMAGPFEYEHAIVKTEGCTACHFPHGGPNPSMLARARVDTICLLCHFPPQISSTGQSLAQAHNPKARVQLCIDCHADIHGSNASILFLKKK